MSLTPGLNFPSPPPREELSSRALERRLKRYFLKETHVFSATCEPAFTPVLLEEVKCKLQPLEVEKFTGGVEFNGKLETGLAANLLLRSAQRVHLRIGSFVCKSYPELFNKLSRVPWELYLGIDPTIDFKVSSRQSKLHQTDNIADTVFSGIETYYARFSGKVSREAGKIRIYIRFHMDHVIISVDLSGEHLHRRGKKQFSVDAPMRENLAAGLLLWKKISGYPVIIDPCCGSGTLIFEAAEILRNLSPGRDRTFSFQDMPWFNPGPWERMRTAPAGQESRTLLVGNDIEAKCVAAALENSRQYGLGENLAIQSGDALKIKNLWGEKGLLVSNLPYGKRVGDRNSIEDFYQTFGVNLAREFPGWDILLISSRKDLLEKLPLDVKNTIRFRNGGLKVLAVSGSVNPKT